MIRAVILAALFPALALAGAPRYHPHTFSNLATSACPTGSPGTDTDGVEFGISLAGIRGFKATICPTTEGATLTGAGSLKVCTYSASPWGPGQWALSPELTWDMTGKTSTTDNPCIELAQLLTVIGLSDRVFIYPSTDFGVSAGGVKVYLAGELR